MRTKTKKVHYCDFCSKRYFQKPFMILHEEHCIHNPKNHATCLEGCANLVAYKRFGRTYDFYCDELKQFMHTSIVEARTVRPERSELSVRMPSVCSSKVSGSEQVKDWEEPSEIY